MNAYHSKEDLKLRVEEALKHTSDCVSTSELWIRFADGKGHYSNAWNTFRPTLDILCGVLFEGLVLSLYKPLEPEGRTIEFERVNLRRILSLAGELKVLDTAAQTKLKQKLRSVEHIWSKAETLRHNLVAHGKTGLSVGDELQRSSLISSEWKKLYAVYAEVLNPIAEKLGVEKLDIEARRVHFAANAMRFFEVLDS